MSKRQTLSKTVRQHARATRELWGWKNCQKLEKSVIEPLCSFNKLTGSNGYLSENDRLEYHKLMTTEVKS